MNKHTKGPWHFAADARENGFERTKVPFDYKGSGFCGNPSIYGADGEEVVGCDEYYVFSNEADVRLICAAPEMLEALQGALKALDSIGDEMTVGERYTNAGQYLLDALQPARSAIAKATGVNDE